MLLTTHNWFVAPDGEQYKSVFGTVKAIHSDSALLGIKTNRHSTDWYVEIGNMIVAGCQIYYAIKTNSVSLKKATREVDFEGETHVTENSNTRIYCADD